MTEQLKKDLLSFFDRDPYSDPINHQDLAWKLIVYLAHERWYVPEGHTSQWTLNPATGYVNSSPMFALLQERAATVLHKNHQELQRKDVQKVIEALVPALLEQQPKLIQGKNPFAMS